MKYLVLYIIGGFSYCIIEILWRGYSHVAMFILGGLCFILIGSIGEYFFPSRRITLRQLLLSCLIITLLELLAGLVLNIKFGLNIWDYSKLKFNFMGQIALEYSILWFLLSLPAIVFYDYMVYWLFGGEKPAYRLI
ncbi:MAG TPA: hypothetical protein GXX70_03500 [Tepidimicrobium sp.]|nr:hypothetical protein [Tepidimicrobium sp.]